MFKINMFRKNILVILILLVTFTGSGCTTSVKAEGTGAENTVKQIEAIAVAEKIKAPQGLAVECKKEIGNGEPFIVRVNTPANIKSIQVRWMGKDLQVPVALIPDSTSAEEHGFAEFMLCAPLLNKESSYVLIISALKNDKKVSNDLKYDEWLQIVEREYPVQELTVDSKYVTPPPSELARIERDRKEMNKALGLITQTKYWTVPFKKPVPGSVSSLYGMRRVFNNVPKNPHKGLDLRGAEGTPVESCAAGKVILAANHYYSGQVVVVDHGLGVKTIYMHLSAIKTKVGDFVETGQVIGLVGKTGRVTGPHLHLGLNVLGESVNPSLLIPDLEIGDI